MELFKNVLINNKLNSIGQELNRDIIEEIEKLNPNDVKTRKELNKDRIKALGLKLIQGERKE